MHSPSKHLPKTTLRNQGKMLATLCLSSTLVFGGLMLDTATPSAHAEETEVNVDVPLRLAITSNTPLVTINASNTNQFYTESTTITSTTNNPTGYTLTMADKDTNTSLVNDDYDSTTAPASFAGTIDSITSSITVDSTGSNFTVNKWGYAKDSAASVYLPIPASTAADEIKVTDGPAETSTTTVIFGTKVNKDLVSGTYEDTVVFSLTANFVPPKKLKDLTSMQQLANYPEVCANATVGDTATLPDERDLGGKEYRVRKLADGNCWMIDNMKLAGVTIEPTLSNVPAGTSFSLPVAVVVNMEEGGPTWANQAKESHVIDAISVVASDSYLYNWFTATAGAQANASDTTSSLMTAASGSAAGDICPKGWQLPDNEGSKSFYNLYNVEYPANSETYPYRSSVDMRKDDGIYPAFTSNTSLYNHSTGLVDYVDNGYYWSRTVNSATKSYYLYFTGNSVYPQYSNNKGVARAVRCVSAGQ